MSEAPLERRRAPRRGVGPFSLRQVTLVGVVIVVAAVVLTLASVPLGSVDPGLPRPLPSAFLVRDPVEGLEIGATAPELVVDLAEGGRFELSDLDGNPIRLADLRGRVVWLNFWASWCPPCQFETPILRAIDQRYRDRGLSLVGIQVQQTVEDGRLYADRYDLEYVIGADVAGHVFRAYRVFALPTQFFIDPEGRIRQIVNGPLSEDAAAAIIEALLPPGSSTESEASPTP